MINGCFTPLPDQSPPRALWFADEAADFKCTGPCDGRDKLERRVERGNAAELIIVLGLTKQHQAAVVGIMRLLTVIAMEFCLKQFH